MPQTYFDVVELHKQLNQVVVVENAELTHQDHIVHLLTLIASKYLPLGHRVVPHQLVRRSSCCPWVRIAVLGCVLRSQLLLTAPVSVGDHPSPSLLVACACISNLVC